MTDRKRAMQKRRNHLDSLPSKPQITAKLHRFKSRWSWPMRHRTCSRALAAAALLQALHRADSASSFRALVLADFHFDELYVANSDTDQDCRRGVGAAGEFGMHSKICDTPKVTMTTALADASRLGPFDLVLFLGDAARHDQDSQTPTTGAQVRGAVEAVEERSLNRVSIIAATCSLR